MTRSIMSTDQPTNEEEETSFNDSTDSVHDPSENEDDEQVDDEYYVQCPCCETCFIQLPPDCEHFLLEYDASFRETTGDQLTGLLGDLREGILALLARRMEPSITDASVKDLWDEISGSYNPGDTAVRLDAEMLMDYMDQHIDELGGIRFQASEQDGAPGYSSSMLYYFSGNPEKFAKEMTRDILQKIQ